jgi:acylphosphatase
MGINRFYIKSNGRVAGVGLRAGLGSNAAEYDLEIACRNVSEDLVEVVVNGLDENVKSFHSYVAEHDIRLFQSEKMYEVTELESYMGPLPDWSHYTDAFMLEHLEKGFRYVGGKLDNIDEKMQKLIDVLSSKQG